ncbi:DUF6702 family protein [Tamlana fucoidanivorans]|uniref:DUF6702 family protein n=1 Tax=Allotamlana fucoidanivorans TaxID=2583814 RepID=UPI001E654409
MKEKQSLQIISRIFIDDFESLLRERFDDKIILLDNNDESERIDGYIGRYLKDKLSIKINGTPYIVKFLGKAYDTDVIKCYMEIEGITEIKSFEISNKVLFDLFEDQQNIIKTNINNKQKSFILLSQNDSVVLKFD